MSAHHWVKPSCELLQVLQNTPKGDIGVVRIEEHTENGLSSTGILNHLGVGWESSGALSSHALYMDHCEYAQLTHRETGAQCYACTHTCLAKNIVSSLLSCTTEPAGSSPARHLKRKMSP